MNEIAPSVSRQSTPSQQRFPAVSATRRLMLGCALASVTLLLTVTTSRDADRVPAQAPITAPECRPRSSASAIDRDAAARNAMFRPALAATQLRNRFEPEPWGDDRAPVALASVRTPRAFSSPMWRFLLDGPVRPDIDLTHNQAYYGVMVTLPFGG